ncbi:baeRF2 domain-containing protein [Streptomyces sp. 6N223]|uniref:baeRF2 domain-containing protein n=1 Tax=Streptomyces sp. 6N223 TaxID=3457412 RepID=UPI003FD057DD
MRTISEISDGVLRDLLAAPGPVTSVYFGLEPRPQQAEDAELRWHSLARHLAGQSAGIDTIEALGGRVRESLPGSGTLAAFAAEGEVLYAAEMPGPLHPDLAVHGPLPHLLPLLRWRQDHPAHVLAVVDRTGADLEAYARGSTAPTRQTVLGPDDEIERNAPGGWSQARYQHRAEDSWEHNAARVADALGHAASRVRARLVLLAGDVRAVQYLTKHLPEGVRHRVAVRTVSGGRSADGAAGERRDQVAAETHRAASEETWALLRRMADERGPGGRTVEGVRPTLEALARGQLGTLVIVHDPADRRTAFFGPDPTDVSDRRRVLGRRAAVLTRAPLADVAVRAAVLTGAEVRVLAPDLAPETAADRALETAAPEGVPAHGIGGLCRYT